MDRTIITLNGEQYTLEQDITGVQDTDLVNVRKISDAQGVLTARAGDVRKAMERDEQQDG